MIHHRLIPSGFVGCVVNGDAWSCLHARLPDPLGRSFFGQDCGLDQSCGRIEVVLESFRLCWYGCRQLVEDVFQGDHVRSGSAVHILTLSLQGLELFIDRSALNLELFDYFFSYSATPISAPRIYAFALVWSI